MMNNLFELMIRRSRGVQPTPPTPPTPSDPTLVWYTPFTTDYTETIGNVTGVPTSSGICEIVPDSRFGGYLNMHKYSGGDLTGLQFPNTQNALQFGTDEWTMSFWLNAPYWNDYGQAIISHRGNGTGFDNKDGFVLFKDSSTYMDMRIGANSNQATSSAIPTDDTWHNWVFIHYSDGDWEWYKDGEYVEGGAGWGGDATSNGNVNVFVGGDGDWGKSAVFKLCHLRIYNRYLEYDEIRDFYHEFDPVPVVPTDYHERWALQSDRNSTKYPSDTNHTLNRSTNASVSYGASGGMTGATVSSGCLYNTNAISGTVSNGYCLSIWCKCSTTPTSSTNIKCFANPANSTQYGLWLGYRQNKYAVGCDMTTSSLRSVSDVSVDTSWHNLVANYDKTNLKVDLWIDGVKAATLSLSSAISKGSGIVVNAGNVTDVTAPDYMPDVSVKYAYVTTFTRTLSDAEVQGLYHEFD